LVRHTQNVCFVMLDFEIFIFESWAIDEFAASSVMIYKISTLSHKALHHSMKYGSFVAESFLMSRKLSKVLAGFGYDFVKELEFDSPSILSIN